MRYLFFAYREWAINIFKNIRNSEDQFILITNKESCNFQFIHQLNPDSIFFYGWSWIVEQEIIDHYTCLCLHPSKLPKYRGGSPIQNQIICGEKKSAVTIFKMGDGLDNGPIFYQKEFDLSGYLSEILKQIETLGIEGTIKFINDFKNNKLTFTQQNENEATLFKRLKPSDSEIKLEDFLNHNAEYFYNKVRGLQKPYPEAYIKCETGRIILKNIDYEE
jgi:methionyl-tRNA formyltransferase